MSVKSFEACNRYRFKKSILLDHMLDCIDNFGEDEVFNWPWVIEIDENKDPLAWYNRCDGQEVLITSSAEGIIGNFGIQPKWCEVLS